MSDKEQIAIARLQEASKMSLHVYKQPLVVTTSGGKDSSVCVALAERAGIPFEVQHNHTTADAPETVYFVRDEFKRLEAKGIKCIIDYPIYNGKRTSMWELICMFQIPPTRVKRYCCTILKERGGQSRFITTGVRWDESVKRKENRGIYETLASKIKDKVILNNDNDDRRMLFENCRIQAKRVCNPIIDWTHRDVWDYIQAEHIPLNPLYQCGFDRVGCIGCPMARKKRYREFAKFPKYKNLYITAFARMIEERNKNGGKRPGQFKTAEEVFHWWMEDGVLPGQINFGDLLADEEYE